MTVRRGIFVAPFDELYDPRLLARLAARAEERGWDGFFVWDHVVYSPPVRSVADPWVALAAVACATERVAIGPLVTPLARRRVAKLARETVTLDHLSGGRTVFGAGLGGERHGEFGPFGDPDDPRERARLLDEGLERLAAYWDGELEPGPAQRADGPQGAAPGRIPVWIAGRWPNRRPLRRAARWDGFFPIDLHDPAQLAEMTAELRELRGADAGPFEVIVSNTAGDPADWEAAGATWRLEEFGPSPSAAEVRAAIDAGP